MSYVPSRPFLLEDTIRNNIVFGLKYQANRFSKVCEVTGLLDDLQGMPDGNEAFVTENG